jgi:hypothetical protein
VLTPTELEDVSVPVAEPRGGLDGGQVLGLFQASQQLLCATKNEPQLRLRYDTARAVIITSLAGERTGQDLVSELGMHPVTI